MNMHCLLQLSIILQVTGITSGRAAALFPAALGLISLILGYVALHRARKKIGNNRLRAIIPLALASIGFMLSVLHLMSSRANNIGTGSGKLGAIVALILTLPGSIISFVALRRSGKGAIDS